MTTVIATTYFIIGIMIFAFHEERCHPFIDEAKADGRSASSLYILVAITVIVFWLPIFIALLPRRGDDK